MKRLLRHGIDVSRGDTMHILYHVSFDPVEEFILRIPKNRCPGEDDVTPRICFAEGLHLAVSSMPQGGQALRGMLEFNEKYKVKTKITPILHCYMCREWEQPGVFLPPEQIKDKVGDAEGTREWWAIKIPKVNHVMMQIFDAKFRDATDKFGVKGVMVDSVERDVIKELPENAPELWFGKRGISVRRAMQFVDEKGRSDAQC
jgi:hypothetical protein